MNIDNSSLNERYISASTNGSILSWGEEIDIKFEKISLNRTKILVQSQASAQLFSWGKNSGNERAIIETLDEKLKKQMLLSESRL